MNFILYILFHVINCIGIRMTVYVHCFYHHCLLNVLVSFMVVLKFVDFNGCFTLISWFFYSVFSSYSLSHLLVIATISSSFLSAFVNLQFSKIIVSSLFSRRLMLLRLVVICMSFLWFLGAW